MGNMIEARLRELSIELPEAVAPVANYLPYVITGNLVIISGQIPLADGKVQTPGRGGQNLSVEDGQAAARRCALNLLAQAKAAANGDLDRVFRVVRLGGFVNSATRAGTLALQSAAHPCPSARRWKWTVFSSSKPKSKENNHGQLPAHRPCGD